MLAYPIDPLIRKTALALNMDEKMVSSVIHHTFKEIARNRKDFFAPGIRLEDLGSFQIVPGKMRHAASLLIAQIRRGTNIEKNKIILSNLFKSRHTLYDFYKAKEFKERFGS